MNDQVYTFTFYLNGADEITEEIERHIYRAGLSDALLRCKESQLSLVVDRASPSIEAAVRSAALNLRESGAGLWIDHAEPSEAHEILARIPESQGGLLVAPFQARV